MIGVPVSCPSAAQLTLYRLTQQWWLQVCPPSRITLYLEFALCAAWVAAQVQGAVVPTL